MGKAGRNKEVRAKCRVSPTAESSPQRSDVRRAMDVRGSLRSDSDIALWLARAIWRQQTDTSCIEASHTLSAALDLFGIANRVVPVAVVVGDVANDANRVCGRAAVDFPNRNGGPYAGQTPEVPEDSFWVDGGHAVVVCEELDLMLDPTFDQFGIAEVPYVFVPFSQGLFDGEEFWQYTFGGDEVAPNVIATYIEVEDVIETEDYARYLTLLAARELAFVGVVVDFDRRVIDEGTHALYPSTQLLSNFLDQMDQGDFTELERFRKARAKSLSSVGHHKAVPLSWTLAPRQETSI